MYNFRPFNYRYDGVFSRASDAWAELDDGSIRGYVTDERRLLSRPNDGGDWIIMEGPRENYLADPLDTAAGGWDNPATGSSVEDTPGGSASVGLSLATEVINQTFLVGANGMLVAASLYSMSKDAVQLGDINIVNGIPSTTVSLNQYPNLWTRHQRKAVSLSGGGNKLIQFETQTDAVTWGAVVECGPAYSIIARFASHPILDTVARARDVYSAGNITAELLALQGGPDALVVTVTPDFDHSDAGSDYFELVRLSTGNLATTIVVWLAGGGGGTCRAYAGYYIGAQVQSGNITFKGRHQPLDGAAANRLTLTFYPATGTLVVAGALTGNGVFTNSAFAFSPAEVILGGVLNNEAAYSAIAPIALGFPSWGIESIEQLTLNSIKVTFADYLGPVDVLQFDPRGVNDALNPANYVITGTPGLPRVQYVQPGETGASVVLFFDGNIPAGALVGVSPRNLVFAGEYPIGMESGARASCDLAQLTGRIGTVLETVQIGESGDQALFSTWEWSGDPLLRPGVAGVEIVLDDPARPMVNYWYLADETTVAEMEAAIEGVAGHLLRVKHPGNPHVFKAGTDEFEQMQFSNGQDAVVLTLIGVGNEVNATTQALATYPRVDIANPQTERDTPQGAALGTFQVSDTGDLENDHGRTYLRKRIFRRLGTMKAGFFHLAGYGLKPPSGRLFTPTTLRRLKVDVELQVRQEPGVVGVRATVTEQSPGVVLVQLRVQDDNGSFELEGALDFTAE